MKIEIHKGDDDAVRLQMKETAIGVSIQAVLKDGMTAFIADITPLGILRNEDLDDLTDLPCDPDGRISFHPDDPASKQPSCPWTEGTGEWAMFQAMMGHKITHRDRANTPYSWSQGHLRTCDGDKCAIGQQGIGWILAEDQQF